MQQLLPPNAVLLNETVEGKKQALQRLAALASELTQISEHAIFDVIWERERLGTTGVGHGIAIPHGKVAGIEQVQGVFMRLETPIEFDAIDRQPVDLLFMLLAPEGAGADHLKALAQVSRTLRNADLCAKLRSAKDDKAVYNLLIADKNAA